MLLFNYHKLNFTFLLKVLILILRREMYVNTYTVKILSVIFRLISQINHPFN